MFHWAAWIGFKALYMNTLVCSVFTILHFSNNFSTSSFVHFNDSQFTISLFTSTLNFSIQSATHFQGDLYPFVVLGYDYQEHRRQPARRLSHIDNGPQYTWSGLPSGWLEMIKRTNKDRRVRWNHAERNRKAVSGTAAPHHLSVKQIFTVKHVFLPREHCLSAQLAPSFKPDNWHVGISNSERLSSV